MCLARPSPWVDMSKGKSAANKNRNFFIFKYKLVPLSYDLCLVKVLWNRISLLKDASSLPTLIYLDAITKFSSLQLFFCMFGICIPVLPFKLRLLKDFLHCFLSKRSPFKAFQCKQSEFPWILWDVESGKCFFAVQQGIRIWLYEKRFTVKTKILLYYFLKRQCHCCLSLLWGRNKPSYGDYEQENNS